MSTIHTTQIGAPRVLRIVAFLFLLSGALSVLDVINDAMHHKIDFNLNVFSIWIGFGLNRINPRSHFWAQLFIAFWLAAGLFVVVASAIAVSASNRSVGFGKFSGQPILGLVLGALLLLLSCWILSVLLRRDIKALFGK